MESLKFHPGPPCPTLLCSAGWLCGVARLQGGRFEAVFYIFGYYTLYAYAMVSNVVNLGQN
jgi:hypothetical protein